MNDFIARLKAGIDNKKEITFPGRQEKITMRVLTCAEVQKAMLEAEKWMKSQHAEYGMFTADEFNEENNIQTLFLALATPDGQPLAADVHQLRANLTDAERSELVREYNAWQEECSPQVDRLTRSEFDDLIADIKKKPVETVGRISSIVLLKKLIITMADPPSN